MRAQDRRLTLRLIEEELDISKDTAHTTVHDDLGKREICSRFVRHKLTDEQKAKRMETSGGFISMCNQDPSSGDTRPDPISSFRTQNGNRWRSVHRLSSNQKKESRLQ